MHKELVSRQIYQAIVAAKKILVATHFNPDGDAAASLSVMSQALDFLKKDYVLFCADAFEKKLLFLPGLRRTLNQETEVVFTEFDLIITVDCGTVARSCLAEKIIARKAWQKVAEIDHHESVEKVAEYELRLNEAASTTEVLYEWLKINRLPIGAATAEAILLGLLTDTGNFIYSATSEKTLAIASEMLARGANWPKIIKAAKTRADLAVARLWGLVLSRLTVNQRYKVAWTVVRPADFAQCQATAEAVDGLAGFLSRLSDVKAVLLLKEEDNGIIKGSWRACQDGINVAKLCNRLGGGGHAKAAGFQIQGRLKHLGNSWIVE